MGTETPEEVDGHRATWVLTELEFGEKREGSGGMRPGGKRREEGQDGMELQSLSFRLLDVELLFLLCS